MFCCPFQFYLAFFGVWTFVQKVSVLLILLCSYLVTLWFFGSIDVWFLESCLVPDMQKGPRYAAKQVPEECHSCKARADMEVWLLFNSFRSFSCKSYLLVCLFHATWLIDCFGNRFNAHLGKKGISGKVIVSYEQETLSVEVSMFTQVVRTSLSLSLSLSSIGWESSWVWYVRYLCLK